MSLGNPHPEQIEAKGTRFCVNADKLCQMVNQGVVWRLPGTFSVGTETALVRALLTLKTGSCLMLIAGDSVVSFCEERPPKPKNSQ